MKLPVDSEGYLDPMPCMLQIQFEGEARQWVPDGGGIFTEAQLNLVVTAIAEMVERKKKPAMLFWEEASNGNIRKCQFSIGVKS